MLHAVIMAGGSGTRFWPQSRRQLPKQFLRMTGDQTLIQQATGRCQPAISPERTWIVTGAAHAVETARQLPQVPSNQILVEPCGRNTAPCIGLAAIAMLAADPDAIMLVTPADHVISPNEKFQQAVQQAVELIEQNPSTLVLFGIEPTYPSTGFGYIQRGERLTATSPAFHVKSFHEKPNLLTAAQFMATSEYYWNCGIFVWRAQAILDALKEFAPEIAACLERIQPGIGSDELHQLLETEFPQMPSISIDYAVLEKAAGQVCVLEAPFQWDDVGSWQALPRLLGADQNGNTLDGVACAVDTKGCIVRTDNDHLIATIGVSDLIIVHTPTATLVADKRDENAIKILLAEVEKRGLERFL
ncbi:mannose-1-phosphate guanylyltransferase [Schlesneria sp. DSM 10557]|uniref:mannose-1-phosphate guanylyltransferase n=1 Tax=Schlesneria sp. DSM 10557 TaxID=3044399 RepID=UPI0035A15569